MDNTTSCAYLKNLLAAEIWEWCIQRNIWLSVAHVAGTSNVEADILSREINDDLEWALEENIFQKILHKFGKLEVDLFASRLNHKLPKYVALRPDPKAIAVDAFSMSWSNSYFYVFAPFSLTRMILRKIVEDEAEAVLAAPIWPTQSWWPSLLQLLVGHPVQLPKTQDILYLPNQPEKKHPLGKLKLGVFPLSGKFWKANKFRQSLSSSYYSRGEVPPKTSMKLTSKNGLNFQVLEKWIHLSPL